MLFIKESLNYCYLVRKGWDSVDSSPSNIAVFMTIDDAKIFIKSLEEEHIKEHLRHWPKGTCRWENYETNGKIRIFDRQEQFRWGVDFDKDGNEFDRIDEDEIGDEVIIIEKLEFYETNL